MGYFASYGVTAWEEIAAEIMSCMQLTELQRLRSRSSILEASAAAGNTDYFLNGLTDLNRARVLHIIRHGTNAITEDWKGDAAFTMRTALQMWDKYEQRGLVTLPQAPMPSTQIAWSEEQLKEYSDKRVQQAIAVHIDNIPALSPQADDHELLPWLLHMGRAVLVVEEEPHEPARTTGVA